MALVAILFHVYKINISGQDGHKGHPYITFVRLYTIIVIDLGGYKSGPYIFINTYFCFCSRPSPFTISQTSRKPSLIIFTILDQSVFEVSSESW